MHNPRGYSRTCLQVRARGASSLVLLCVVNVQTKIRFVLKTELKATVTLLHYCLEDTRLDWNVSSDGATTTCAGNALHILMVVGEKRVPMCDNGRRWYLALWTSN